jgi:outer membrane protein assembly complex protein YaeT
LTKRWAHSPMVAVGMMVALLTGPVTYAQTDPDEMRPVTVASLTLIGVSEVDESAVRSAMVTESPSRIPFTRKPVYRAADLKADADRIRAFYVARGFPDARVTRMTADVDPEQRTARIEVSIEEGLPRRVGRVEFRGFDALSQRRLDRVRDSATLPTGEPLDLNDLERVRTEAARALRDEGYARATVAWEESPAAARVVDVTFVATPGELARIGPIEITGHEAVNERVIQRLLAFESGEPFRESALEQTAARLRSLELFDFVYVQALRDAATDGQVPVRVTVSERAHRRTDLGVGYGTEEQARVAASWRNVNVGGRGRTVGFESRASALEWGVRSTFVEPYAFSRHLAAGGNAHWWYENEPIYRMRTYGGRATLTWQRDDRDALARRGALTSVGVSVINDYTRYGVSDFALDDAAYRAQLITLGLNPETGEGEGTLFGLRLQLQRSTVTDPLNAQHGVFLSLAAERAGGALPGDFTYTEVIGDARAYRTLRSGLVLAARVRAGGIDGEAGGGVPFFKRYFLGGSTSLRGWGRYDVSPLTESGLPVGGLAIVESSAEVRVPVGESLALVGFVDAGNAWRAPGDIDLSDLRVSVGPGVRYVTPIGPVRVDLGYQLTPIDGLVVRGRPETRRWRIHLSIGQAF